MAEHRFAPKARDLILASSLVGALATLVITVLPGVDFAYRSRAMHVAIETAATLIGLLAAHLVYGRFKRSASRRDLLLVGALLVFAATNLSFSSVPSLFGGPPGTFETWSPVFGRLVGAAAFAAAALLPAGRVSDTRREVRLVLLGCGASLLAIAVVVVLSAGDLPKGIDPGISPEGSGQPRIVGNPVILAIQIAAMLLFAVAAMGFAQRALRIGDELMAWFAAGACLAAFAALNYFLFPSLYSDWVYTGDFLRLGFYLFLLVGSLREIGSYQRELATAVTLDERRRMARELHDGLAQDLAYISTEARRLATGSANATRATPQTLERLSAMAERALDESRDAIAALARPLEEPLNITLAVAAEEVAGRVGATVTLRSPDDVSVPPETRNAVISVVREATRNATHHGEATALELTLSAGALLAVQVSDNGRGFDPSSGRPGFGLSGMRQRAEQLGGELSIRSEAGKGTVVEMRIPWASE